MSAPVIIVTDRETLEQIIEDAIAKALYITPTPSRAKLWLNPDEAAEVLGHHSRKEIIALCNAGKLECHKKGRKERSRYFISRKALEAYDPNAKRRKR